MKNMNIYLNTPEDAINFVSTVSKVPYGQIYLMDTVW